ncbi:MAG: histone deacetylase [Verrucomicrobiae bacterium]|nr:histone deacetylase [Verrucomicrobiae bacterium]
MISLFYHEGYAAPIGEDHIMPMRKFGLVAEKLGQHPRAKLLKPDPISEKDLLRVHTPDYVRAIRAGEPRTLAESQKFSWSEKLFPAVCLTNGGCLAAGRAALKDGIAGNLASGFHHSHADHGEGFCTFNGLIVALDALKEEGLIKHAAILDLDLHYGNGTANLVASRTDFLAISVYGNDYFNNKAYREVEPMRHEDGINHFSIPVKNGADGEEYLKCLEKGTSLMLKFNEIDLILYQAGADPLRDDPYSPLNLGAADLRERDKRVFQFAKERGIPLAWVLAGGYTKDVSKVVEVHVNTFLACSEVY